MRVIEHLPAFPLPGLAGEAYKLLCQPSFHGGVVVRIDLEGATRAAVKKAFRQALLALGGYLEVRPGDDPNSLYMRFTHRVSYTRKQRPVEPIRQVA